MIGYQETFRASVEEPETFWREAATALDWHRAPERVLDDTAAPFSRWYPDGQLNACHNALDRHVQAGHGDRAALIYDSPVTGTKKTYTYDQLLDEVARFAGALTELGIGHGDRVVIYMPMVPEAAIAMLACARIGAVHSVVFGGFAPNELAIRIDDAAPKAVVTASCGIEGKRIIEYKPLLERALELADHSPDHCIVLQRPQAVAELGGRDLDWHEVIATAKPADCVPVGSTDPLYILYTSGTTGKPKGVVRDTGGYAVALTWSMRNIYDVGPGETMFSASDVGWVVGHSYIVYAPLLAGATTVFYEGKPVGTPDPGQFWRVIAENQVKALFTAPTSLRAIKKEDPEGSFLYDYDLSSLRTVFLAGERLDPETLRWAQDRLGIPVIDHWWQTETGWPVAANLMGQEPMTVKPGSATVAVPGWNITVVDAAGRPVPRGTDGTILLKLPLPPGALTTLWNDDERYVSSYLSEHPGYYATGDGGHIDDDGYVFIMGRTDDVINVAGHRLSTGTMEEALAAHPAVAECAVIGVADPLKGQLPRGFVVLKAGDQHNEVTVIADLITLVRDRIGAVAALKDISIVPALPKTRSGKILRKTMRGIADGADEPVPSTIEDAAALDALRTVLRRD
ncbi:MULTISPECIES: propionyl-CoA synthetase [unclassified Saccharopolyspora]|uniref:propionyl-CoA synthetase n=1 Tax=unclassified Saccharopolyspora TaxID=2646250 RepID=UPI00210272C2|nr:MULTISPECIES: propionyl-CoA synthetase [unclassified Saccharopolyspora]